jgi:hypothetical protein
LGTAKGASAAPEGAVTRLRPAAFLCGAFLLFIINSCLRGHARWPFRVHV